MHGLLLLHKPTGMTSNAALSRVKRVLKNKSAGFAGTLDPMATGVLPIALGEATKCLPYIEDVDKEYEFTVRWGIKTDTLDTEGKIISENANRPTEDEIQNILKNFTGEISQIPPAYSAIKINGQRAYDLARAGQAPEMKSRIITIHNLELLPSPAVPDQWSGTAGEEGAVSRSETEKVAEGDNEKKIKNGKCSRPNPHASQGTSPLQGEENHFEYSSFRVTCSKGTYIRSLARDMAYALGTLGHLTALARTRAGKFALADCIALDDLLAMPPEAAAAQVAPIPDMLPDLPRLSPDAAELARLRNGQPIFLENQTPDMHYLILKDGAAFGIGMMKDQNQLWPRRIFVY